MTLVERVRNGPIGRWLGRHLGAAIGRALAKAAEAQCLPCIMGNHVGCMRAVAILSAEWHNTFPSTLCRCRRCWGRR